MNSCLVWVEDRKKKKKHNIERAVDRAPPDLHPIMVLSLNPFARRGSTTSTGSADKNAKVDMSDKDAFNVDNVLTKFKQVEDGLGVWGTPETGDDVNV